MYYADEFVQSLKNARQIVIYGAGMIAQEVALCLTSAPYRLKIACFMVTSLDGNPKEIKGVPVVPLKEAGNFADSLVLLAVMDKYKYEIAQSLEAYHFTNVVSLTFESSLWGELRGNYWIERFKEQNKHYNILEEELKKVQNPGNMDECKIFAVKSVVDRQLKDHISFPWENELQVGAALTDCRIALNMDCTGENISVKNREYCELTGLYWIWKNVEAQYAGLCHYRRHFLLNKEMLEKLVESDIDVVLTIPVLNFPNVREVYAHDHQSADWETMMEVVFKLYPEYRETADEVQNGNCYYGYNMLVAKKDILNEYCSWLFPILRCCEEKCSQKRDPYQKRYIGFLAERLLTIFFIHNCDRWKIVHARKLFLE